MGSSTFIVKKNIRTHNPKIEKRGHTERIVSTNPTYFLSWYILLGCLVTMRKKVVVKKKKKRIDNNNNNIDDDDDDEKETKITEGTGME